MAVREAFKKWKLQIFTCKVNIDEIDCNHICQKTGSSTSNASTHLTAAHNITKSTQFYNGIFIENESQVSPLDINIQETIEQVLMEFIVEDIQPFHILKSKKFR